MKLGKMQKNIRFNENQLIYLVSKARRENTNAGFLYKKSSDTGKWQQRYFLLFQNLLFYFENETATRPLGVVLLEGSYCERIITPLKGKESEKQVGVIVQMYNPDYIKANKSCNFRDGSCI